MKRILLALSLVALASQARGQDWQQLPLPPSGILRYIHGNLPPGITPYFLDSSIGFTFTSGYAGTEGGLFFTQFNPELARTSNGGQTWTKLPFFDSAGCSITQLCFVSLQHGYASTYEWKGDSVGNAGGIYETFDQGNSWRRITAPGLNYSGVYVTKNMVFASEYSSGFGTGKIVFSGNDGKTWDSITNVQGLGFSPVPNFQFIYGNKDSLVATVLFLIPGDSADLVYSADLGKHWQCEPVGSINPDGKITALLTLFIPAHSCEVFVKSPNDDDTYNFLEASTLSHSLDTSINHLEVGAWIAGNSCAMYISNAGLTYSLYRSTNMGSTWSGIGSATPGPNFAEIDDGDNQNLSVVGYGATVYAGASLWSWSLPQDSLLPPSFWKTSDGGDGTLSAATLAPQIEYQHGNFASGNDTLTVSQCAPSSAVVYYQNLQCAITKMDSVSLIGLASNQYTLTSTYHNDCLSMPDSTYITFSSIPLGVYPITIRSHFTDDEYNTIDTTLSFVLVVQASGSSVPITLSFQSFSMNASPGDTISVPVYLSGLASLGATLLTLPFGVDTNMLVPVGFQPAIPGLTVDSAYVTGTGTVPLQSSGLTLNGETLIGYLRCVVYLTDTLSTSITIQGPSINSVNAPCTALSITTDSVNILINGCGDNTLLQFMKTGEMPLAIQSITPNPTSNEIDIRFRIELHQPIAYELIDALGTTRLRGVIEGQTLSLDASSLPQGVYFFRALTEDGDAVTRELEVER